jgi:HD-like signal output (HDOD) protein/DNA-binding NarL/FixJ family response regulator
MPALRTRTQFECRPGAMGGRSARVVDKEPMPLVLIVDDMPIFREPIEAVLRAEGFETATACNGHEALAAIAAAKPALVLLDLGMPIMDGLTCLRVLRGDKTLKATPVIILSAESDRAHIIEAVKLGISGYLLKSGFSLKAMLEKVRATLAPAAAVPKNVAPAPTAVKIEPETLLPTPAPAHTHVPVAPANRDDAPPTAARTRPEQATVVRPLSDSERENAAAVDIKSLKPILTRSDLMERLKACEELKGFSPTVSQVLKLTASPNSSLDAVSKAVRQDQAMALKILKVANSSVYSRGDRVDTVQKAILRIGMESIRQTVLNIGVVERFSSPAFKEHVSTAHFWEHSIACGIIAAEIAHAMDGKEADSAFTSGLLHDLGRIIFAEALGDRYIGVIETARRLNAPLELVETRMLLLNHADVMDRMLNAWKFPKHLVDPIMYHHLSAGGVRGVAPTRMPEILRLGLANRLAHAMLLGTSGNETIYPTEEHCRALNVSPSTIRMIEESARQQTDDTKFALMSHATGQAWPRRSEQLRATLTAPFRPLYVSVAPEIDAFRIFCNELAGPRSEEPPNLAVVHIVATKEQGLLGERLVAAERDAGVQPLPLLVLSPAGQTTLDAAVIGGRRCMTIRTPAAVHQVIAAIGCLLAMASEREAA